MAKRWTEKRINSLVKKMRAYCREASERSVEVIPGDEGKFKILGPELPMIEECLQKSGFNSKYVYELEKKWPQLADVIKKIKDIQAKVLTNMALQGAYNSTFAIFAAKNLLKWNDNNSPLVDQSTHHHITLIAPKEREQELANRANSIPV